jgi:hypothetical protein
MQWELASSLPPRQSLATERDFECSDSRRPLLYEPWKVEGGQFTPKRQTVYIAPNHPINKVIKKVTDNHTKADACDK